ncbi:CDT1-like protein a, chloroplastic [Pistacia vera]|uniref:CDT1-like protein a, chloroplastic n=1 Tax=Pistacia vera TaxID=55513 RepID=UPI001262E02D|nr:CDT1-like protein a, chloroplastic [Pistacia vera]XP_031263015.1 CDT1-like protein a, chloroplastic [Pistacia vera]XP_031263016.1 CDT1-like protein a, chloroplastic [Pistacia vera]
MDQRKFEESDQNVLGFKCEKIINGEEKGALVQKQGNAGSQNFEMKIAAPTPEKTSEPSRTKVKEDGIKHLEKYNALVEIFDSMTCSLRLLSLRKKSPTFQNISTQVEVLTKRKISLKHLAQIKYILPEAIQVDNILVHDKKTLCMKPDMKISLLFDVIEGHSEHSDFIALHQVFASRLLNYFSAHPEADDIPETILPEPFGRRSLASLENKVAEVPEELESICEQSQTTALEQFPVDSLGSLPSSIETEMLSMSCLLHPSFCRHFSRKSVASAFLSSTTSDYLNNQFVRTWQSEECPVDHQTNEKSNQQMKLPFTCSKSSIVNPPFRLISPQCSVTSDACDSPQQKLALPADSLLIETPAQVTPKRSMPSCNDKLKAMTTQNCKSHYKPAKRSLDFSYLEGEESVLDSAGVSTYNYNDSDYDIPKALEVETKEFIEEGGVVGSPEVLEKVKGSLGEVGDCKMSQTGLAVDQQISVCLADLVAVIHQIFQSVNRASITKQELVHKIIMNNLDIIERREVEDQIEHLEKMVPDWICRKQAPGGDIMYNIKKVSDLASVQARLC